MNSSQKDYLLNTPRDRIELRAWAELSDLSDPSSIDVIWLQAVDSLKFSKHQDRRDAYNRLQKYSRASRMRIWEQLHQDRAHADSLRPIANEQVRIVSEDVTRALRSEAKRKAESEAASASKNPRSSPKDEPVSSSIQKEARMDTIDASQSDTHSPASEAETLSFPHSPSINDDLARPVRTCRLKPMVSSQDLLPSDGTDPTYEETSSNASFHVELEAPDFLSGSGRRDSNVDDEWIHDGFPLSKPLFTFRDWCIANQHELRRPHEMLAVNFIFLLESEDQIGGLKDEMSDRAWQALWAALQPVPIKPLDDSLVLSCYQWAGQASALSFTKFVEALDDSPPKSALLNRILVSYTASKELWTSTDSNEATHVKNSLAPCLDALFPRVDNAEASWEQALGESKDSGQRLLVPDYTVATTVREKTFTVLLLEAKVARNNVNGQIWDDLTKLGHEMKLALDSILLTLPEEEIIVQGIILKGYCLQYYQP
ncbi:hypothetical protein BGZ73_001177 [Actinomortierella ambigua]|nr:hypothetical protein BGZ73_001177 [Actinomortierella ambigua]